MNLLDCRGQQCPLPVVQVRRQILAAPGTPLQVLVNDSIARDNVKRLAASLDFQVKVEQTGETFRMELTPGEKSAAVTGGVASGPTVVFITSDQMGSGDPELGHLLLKNFLFTLAENDTAPDQLLFVNAGARLPTEGSDVLEALQKLADLGTDIATCGLCLEFFGLKESLRVGRTTNMLEIVTALQTAGRTVRP